MCHVAQDIFTERLNMGKKLSLSILKKLFGSDIT